MAYQLKLKDRDRLRHAARIYQFEISLVVEVNCDNRKAMAKEK